MVGLLFVYFVAITSTWKMSLPCETKEISLLLFLPCFLHAVVVFVVVVDDVRLERDKAEALNHQKEAMNRAFRVQLAKLLKEKEDLQRKCQILQQTKEPTGKVQGVTSSSTASSQPSAEVQKLIHENAVLRIEKKKQEEQLQVTTTATPDVAYNELHPIFSVHLSNR